MISDLDELMEAGGLESLLVAGSSTMANPELAYVVGTQLARGGIYVKRRGHKPVLVTSQLDVGSARKGRVRKVKMYSDYGYEKLVQKHGRNEGRVRLYENIVRQEGLRGPMTIMGTNEVSDYMQLAEQLRRRGLKVKGQERPTILEVARETKDAREIRILQDVSEKTMNVVRGTLDLLRKTKVSGRTVTYKGKPLTVGTVKKLIGRLLAENNLIAPEGTIFAPGRKSADPHYSGDEKALVHAHEPIVFDIFPQAENGYWSDMTRTYCIGQPPRKLKEMYDAVLQAQLETIDMMKDGGSGKEATVRACDIFEKRGYLTYRDFVKGNKQADRKGFNHALGHGVGLTIGERPVLTLLVDDTLKKGAAVTVEPGLYDPQHGGVRLEDVVVVGSPYKDLTPLDRDFEL